MALLGLVNESDCLVRQPEQHFLLAGGRNAAPISADVLRYGAVIGFNGSTFFYLLVSRLKIIGSESSIDKVSIRFFAGQTAGASSIVLHAESFSV